MEGRRRAKERRAVSERTFLEVMVILVAILVGELVWIVLFTVIAVWLRGL
jgi:hypothetical protein